MALPFDDIASTTIDAYVNSGKLIDNIFKKHFLWSAFYRKGRVKYRDGGDQISVTVLPKTNSQAAFIAPYDTIGTNAVETATRGRYNWRQAVCSIVISEKERLQNNGSKEQIVDLLDGKIRQSELSLREAMSTELWAATASAQGLLPLRVIILDSGTLGGIDSSVETWWKAQYDNQAIPLSIKDMSNMYNKTVEGADIIATSQTLWEKYESLLQPQQRFMDAETAKAGFDNLRYKKAPVLWDEQAPSDEMLFLNTEYLYPVVHRDADFKSAPSRQPVNQLVFVSHIHWMGNIVTDNRRRLGRLDGRTA